MSITLYNDDCLERMKDLSDNIAQVFFCDLPYGCTVCKWDTPIDLKTFWKEALRIGKDNCVYAFTATMKFAITLINSNPKMFRYECIIQKNRASNFLVSNFRHLPNHEFVLVFYKKKPKWNKLKYHKPNEPTWNPSVPNQPMGDSIYRRDLCMRSKVYYEPRLPKTVLPTIQHQRRIHPTRKDPKLIKELLKYWTDENDVVIDPTMGSGATGEACKELGLHFIGMEMDEKWYNVAKERLS